MSDEQDDVDMDDLETDDDTDPWDRRSWTTDEQWRWLQKTRPPYLAAQKARKLGKYLTTMQREYLSEWSECLQLFGHRDVDRLTEEQRDQLREAERKKKKQLVVWHKNRDRKRQSVRSLSTLLGAVGISKKCGRLPQEQELYSDQYYKSDILPLVEARRDEIEADLGKKLDAKQRLNNVKACTKQAWDDAPAAVKRDIRKTLKKMKEDRKAGRAGRGLDIDVADRTPQQYQDAVDLTPQVIQGVLDPLCKFSGWTISVIGAGPVPEDNGAISSMSAHFGHDKKSENFAQTMRDFDEQYVVPFSKYARSVFPRTVRDGRSLKANCSRPPIPEPPIPEVSEEPSPPVASSSGSNVSASVTRDVAASQHAGGPAHVQSARMVLGPEPDIAPPSVDAHGFNMHASQPSAPSVRFRPAPMGTEPAILPPSVDAPDYDMYGWQSGDPLAAELARPPSAVAPILNSQPELATTNSALMAIDGHDGQTLAFNINAMTDEEWEAMMQWFRSADPNFLGGVEQPIPDVAALRAAPDLLGQLITMRDPSTSPERSTSPEPSMSSEPSTSRPSSPVLSHVDDSGGRRPRTRGAVAARRATGAAAPAATGAARRAPDTAAPAATVPARRVTRAAAPSAAVAAPGTPDTAAPAAAVPARRVTRAAAPSGTVAASGATEAAAPSAAPGVRARASGASARSVAAAAVPHVARNTRATTGTVPAATDEPRERQAGRPARDSREPRKADADWAKKGKDAPARPKPKPKPRGRKKP